VVSRWRLDAKVRTARQTGKGVIMDTYRTDGTPVEINPVDRKSGGAPYSRKLPTVNGDTPFQTGRGPGRGEDKPSRRYAQDSPEHK